MKTVALAGGTGSAKLLRGLQAASADFAVVSNVGDNFWHKGLYICPDIDIAIYSLAGMADTAKGWGIEGDTFNVLSQLKRMGEEAWFNLGDRDLATHIFRTAQLSQGKRLGEVTKELCKRLAVTQTVAPCTDDSLETHIGTIRDGRHETMHLQEFWVREGGSPGVTSVSYVGAETATTNETALRSIEEADRIVFCPANPVTSILPMLSVRGLRDAIAESRARRVAVSPMIGMAPVNGPAGKMMNGLGLGSDSLAVAKLYRGLIDCLIIDSSDGTQRAGIEREGIEVASTTTLMNNREEELELASMALRV
jgi:LPPG:FO 2-phospho-L-lactate transferase